MFSTKKAIEYHSCYFSLSKNKPPEVYERNTCTIISSKGGIEKTVKPKNNIFIEKMKKLYNLINRIFVDFESQGHNYSYIYYFRLKGQKIYREDINKNIKLYRKINIILAELQRHFYIEYLRDEDFTISDEGDLLFNNFSSLVLLDRHKKPKCKCGQDLIIDIECFLQSEDKIFVSRYKCLKCLKQYSITELKEYQIQKQRSIDDE